MDLYANRYRKAIGKISRFLKIFFGCLLTFEDRKRSLILDKSSSKLINLFSEKTEMKFLINFSRFSR